MREINQSQGDGRGAHSAHHVLRISAASGSMLLLALTLLLLPPHPAIAADLTCPGPASTNPPAPAEGLLPELDEVIVSARKPVRRTRDLSAWLMRLAGQYRYEGHVDLCGQGHAADQRPVTGKADCVVVVRDPGEVPMRGLYCVVDVRWPQVSGDDGAPSTRQESDLLPAVVVYGVVPELPGIQFMQIDNDGIATHARGQLTGDTLTARESCAMASDCQKVTRITARPDSENISMVIDVEVDSRRVQRHALLLHRTSNIEMRPNKQNLRVTGER